MKQGMTLQDMTKTLSDELKSKKDFVVTTSILSLTPDGSAFVTGNKNSTPRTLTEHCHGQVAARLQIPKNYYDRMRTGSPELLVTNVNHWLHAKPERRMIRTVGTTARAFLSDRFLPIDSYDIMDVTLPAMLRAGCKVESCALTETRMYLKAVTPKIQGEIKKGDIVQMGLCLSNSEVGAGRVLIEPIINRLACLNGLIVNDAAVRKYHVGKLANVGDGIEGTEQMQYFKPETFRAINKAFLMSVKDVVDAVLTKEVFNRTLEKMRVAADTKQMRPVVIEPVCTELQNVFQLSDDERSGIMSYLSTGNDLSLWGAVNAMTRAAQDVESYERATEMERFGGQLLELSTAKWNELIA